MNRIEDQARYFNNIPLRDRKIKAVVHLEDKDLVQNGSMIAYRPLMYVSIK